jgi:tetratricopeptide (TPR) repeat protein
MKEIADFVEKVYLRRDFTGFKGDRKFVRDDQAQKAFSKLRSSIGGVYAWRISDPNNHNPATQQRMIREADFVFRQALAFCPYSPEAVFRYVNLLLSLQKIDDALLVAETCLKLDPFNAQIIDLVDRLRKYKSGRAEITPAQKSLVEAESAYQRNPSNLQNAFNLAGAYLQAGQTPRAQEILDGVLNDPRAEAGAYRALLQAYTTMSDTSRLQMAVQKIEAKTRANPAALEDQVVLAEGYRTLQQKDKALQTLDQVMSNPKLDPNVLLHAAQEYAAQMNYAKLESALQKLTTMVPDSPEAWYDLAALKATLGSPKDALPSLKTALELSKKRHDKNPKERDLVAEVQKDNRLAAVRQLPEYKQIIPK